MKSTRAGYWLRLARSIAVVVAIVYVVFLSVMFIVMSQPPQRFGQIMRYFPMPAMMILPFERMWNVARGGELRVGEEAPDFTLPRTDKSGTLKLSSLRGKPVVLVFGSYS